MRKRTGFLKTSKNIGVSKKQSGVVIQPTPLFYIFIFYLIVSRLVKLDELTSNTRNVVHAWQKHGAKLL